jgi:hypothetical protein
MEFLNAINQVTTAQLEFFAVATILVMIVFATGFVFGRSTRSREVKVPVEVLHALATARFSPRMDGRGARADSKEDKIEDEIEHLLDHVEHHEKDFNHAKAHVLHELDRIIHDYGSTPDLAELHKKVEHAHNIPEIVAALKWYISRHHH